MLIPNKTHYHSPLTRTYNIVPDPNCFAAESSKRVGYQQRLYWEYELCKKVHGQAFFYTFTYNDNAIPYAYGYPCFSYDDIRLVTNGLISKELLRHHGSMLKYFVACETGEGGLTHNYVGKRGLGNNPHYHVIFYVIPKPKKGDDGKVLKPYQPDYDGYVPITPQKFRDLCKKVWQYKRFGMEVYVCDWKDARFGHVQEGQNLGLIDGDGGFSYVAKYVTKDAIQKDRENKVLQKISDFYRDRYITYDTLYDFYGYIKQSCDDRGEIFSLEEFEYYSAMSDYKKFLQSKSSSTPDDYEYYVRTYRPDIMDGDLSFYAAIRDYFTDVYFPKVVKEEFRNYINQYGAKVRCSKSLGAYGLTQICAEEFAPFFSMRGPTEMQSVKPSLYYYRKLYYDVVTCPVTGNPLYVLNDKGIRLKMAELPTRLHKFSNTLLTAVLWFLDPKNQETVVRYLDSSVALEPLPYFEDIKDKVIQFRRIRNGFFMFSTYQLIYRYRSFLRSDDYGMKLTDQFNMEDIYVDYDSILRNNFYALDYAEQSGIDLMCYNCYNNHVGCVPTSLCKPFEQIIPYVKYLDFVLDAYNCFNSNHYKEDWNAKQRLKSLVSSDKFNHKYA